MLRTILAVALGVGTGAACYALFHTLAPLVFSSRPSDSVAPWLAIGAPVASMLLCGVVSALVVPQRWVVASVSSGVAGTAFFLWLFDATGYWFFFALAFAIGLAISISGGFLGSRIPYHAIRAP